MNFYSKSVVLTTGTFMSGKVWIGRTSMPAGRAGESASLGLSEYLQSLGFETDRFKTRTPAHVDSRTVDFSFLEPPHGDEEMETATWNIGTRYYVRAVTPTILYSFTGIGSLEDRVEGYIELSANTLS